ncbi:TPA: trigger factor [Candidatus Berkelbacteria bacterium]|uniref:Trigger factor n=1 Tax=Berkelbacteria bacterium GW2011_GWE1_39_12 TaxID=1618337 RepID=A0A0G4B3H8_9BACT|nr:MAG: tig, trigger factor, trigger factor [Berkelbacteria bacterium GW2011_GWE1_39_12]HBO60633.1 trigger factor [Candidatus Berkelbacteria bacterium]
MLNVIKENLPKSKIKLSVTLPPEIMRGYFAKVYEKLAPSVNIKGFRPGKAPKHLTIMEIGENRFNSEIIDMALSESYGQVLKQEKLIPVAPPKVEIKKMVDLTADNAEIIYEAELDVLPEVKLGDYKKIKIKKAEESKLKVTKDELDQVFSHLQRQHAEFKGVERAAKEGDRVEMDFEGTERSVVLENLTSKNYPVVLGSKVLIPEFEKKVEGMKAGDEKEFDIELGKGSSPENISLKKKVHFKVKMNLVQEVILPKLDDELATKFGQKNLDDLKKVVEADVLNQKKRAERQNKENEVIEALLKITEVEVPDSLVEQETQRMVDQLKTRTEGMGLPFDKYLESMGKSEEDLKKDMSEQAAKTVKVGLTLGEIGKQEKIDLSKEDSGLKVIEKLVDYATK